MLRLPHRCHLLLRYHKHILAVAALATVVGAYLTSRLSLQSDLADLLPAGSTSVQALERMKEEVGGIGQLRLVLETDSFPAAKQLAQDLEPRLLASPFVSYVDYSKDVAFYKRNALLFLEPASLDSLQAAIRSTIDAEKQRLNPLFVEDLFGDASAEDEEDELARWEEKYRAKEPKPFYTNADSTILVIKVFASRASSNLSFALDMVDDVRRIVDSAHVERYDPDIKVYYGGNVQNRLDEYETVKRDIIGTAIYGVGGVFLLIALYFSSLVGALLVSLSLLASLSWTFGLTFLVIGQLNTITGFLFVILFGLGVDYGIHAFARYVESRRHGLSREAAIDKMVCQTGTALATTAITTSAAFFSLMLMDFKGFSDLGFIAGVGMLGALVAMVVLLPALIVLAENIGVLRIEPATDRKAKSDRASFRHARGILVVATVFTAIAGYSFSRVGFEFDFTNLRAITPQRNIVSDKTRGVFTLSESPAIVLGDSRGDVEEIVAAVRQHMESDTLSPTVSSVKSIFSLVPEDQSERLERIAAIRALIEEEAGVVEGEEKQRIDDLKGYLRVDAPFTWKEFPENDKRQFIDKKGQIGNFVFVYPSVPLRDGRNAIEFRDDIGTIVTESGKVFHAASSNIIAAEMLELITVEGWMSGALAFGVVFLIVLADFRTIKATVLVLSPLAIGVLWMGGTMYLGGMKLNFFNIAVLPSVIGIGVDNGVHLYHRYLEEGSGSLYFVLKRTGLTIGMTTLTTIVGYSGLILARHPGLRSMGNLAVIGLSTTFVAAVVVLPALIRVFVEKEVTHESGPEASA